MKPNYLRIGLGIIIFMFSAALAYFSADYIAKETIAGRVTYNDPTYWSTLLSFAAGYIVVGIFMSKLVPISMGFLFAADILLLDTLMDRYSGIAEVYKTFILGALLLVAFLFAWFRLRDTEVPAPVMSVGSQ